MGQFILVSAPAFIARVVAHEATRRALATAVAGMLVGTMSEALWPKRPR